MSTTGRQEADAPASSDVAGRLAEADFVRLVSAATGDALAATGLIARTLDGRAVPFQASTIPLPASPEHETTADLHVAIGRPVDGIDAQLGDSEPASAAAFEVARSLEGSDDASLDSDAVVLGLAGVQAAGQRPGEGLQEAVAKHDIHKRAGVARPTDEVVDGLARHTGVLAPFSGSTDDVATLLGRDDLTDPLEDDERRTVASLVALAVAGDESAVASAATTVEGVLNPWIGSRFGTVGGFADVLRATAATDPGLGLELALGSGSREAALECWQDHGRRVHEAIAAAETRRFDGLVVAEATADAPLTSVARLVRDYRSPEPIVLAVTDGTAVALADTTAGLHVGDSIASAAAGVDSRGDGTPTRGRAIYSTDTATFVDAFREEVV